MSQTLIVSIDGETVPGKWNLGAGPQILIVKVTPGEHELMLRYSDESGRTGKPVPFHITVQAGTHYSLYPVSPTLYMRNGDPVSFKLETLYSAAGKAETRG